MGTKFSLKCNKCGYEVLTSAGHDFGMLAVVETHTCKACKMIVDVTVGEYGITYSKEEALSKKGQSEAGLNFHVCPNCSSGLNLGKWDPKTKPCPKCNGKMGKDKHGVIMSWD